MSAARRLQPLSGAAFVIIVLVAVIGLGGNTPGPGDPAEKVRSFYDTHQTTQQIAAFVLAAGVPLLILFAISLALAFWPADARSRGWQLMLVSGSVLAGAAFAITAQLHFSLADLGHRERASIGAIQALNELDATTWLAFNTGLGVMLLGAAGTLIPRRGSFRVLGWIALPAGIALFIPFADFIALLASALWIIATSIALVRTASAE
jgi:hypothetical protein